MTNRLTQPPRQRGGIQVLYQDKCLAVLVKPCGMLSVPHQGSDASRTAVGALEAMMRREGTYSYQRRPLAVHRLDRDTSGVMMMALGEKWRGVIMERWQTMVTERLYRAVVEVPRGKGAGECPLLRQDCGDIDLPLAMDKYGRAYVPRGISTSDYSTHHDTKLITALTHYRVLLRGHEYMLLELSLDTGRKNQIRAHVAALGCPVTGDEHRGARSNPLGRLALHARTLCFRHPQSGEIMRFEVSEPQSWSALVAFPRQANRSEAL